MRGKTTTHTCAPPNIVTASRAHLRAALTHVSVHAPYSATHPLAHAPRELGETAVEVGHYADKQGTNDGPKVAQVRVAESGPVVGRRRRRVVLHKVPYGKGWMGKGSQKGGGVRTIESRR